MIWTILLFYVLISAVSLFAIYSVVQDFQLGPSHIYGRPMSSRRDAPLGFTFDGGLKLLFTAIFAALPTYFGIEMLQAS